MTITSVKLNVCVLSSAVLAYRVEVCTGRESDAGTDAGVHLMLVGQRGDTGLRRLLNPLPSTTHSSRPFQPAQVSTLLSVDSRRYYTPSSPSFSLSEKRQISSNSLAMRTGQPGIKI